MTATLERDKDTGRWWLSFPGKPAPDTIAKLKASGWRWGSFRKAWFNASRFAKVPEGVEYEEGGLVEYAAERAERLEERAEKAEARSTAAFETAHRISDGIPLGQPILVGHHSERRARRDADRIHSALTKGCEEGREAERLAQAARGSALAQAKRHDPGAIARRIAKLEKWLADLEKPRDRARSIQTLVDFYKRTPDEAAAEVDRNTEERERRAAIVREDLARAREELEEAGGIPADRLAVAVDDVVRVKSFVARVVKVNPKTLSCAVYIGGRFETTRWPLKFEKTYLREVIGRYCPACEGGAKPGCATCGGPGYTVNAPPAAAESEVA